MNHRAHRKGRHPLLARRVGPTLKAAVLLEALCTTGCRAWDYDPIEPISYVDSVAHYPADGGVIISTSRDPDKGICVAPPAQGAVTINFSVSGKGKRSAAVEYQKIKVSKASEAEFAASLAESLTKLYEQNEQTLFLQHSLYRLCEAYVNGLFDATPYSEWLYREASAAQREITEETAEAARLTAAQGRVKDLTGVLEAAKADLEEKRKREEVLADQVADAQDRLLSPSAKPVDPAPARVAERALRRASEGRTAAQAEMERLSRELEKAKASVGTAEMAAGNKKRLEKLASALQSAADKAASNEKAMLDEAVKPGACVVREPKLSRAGRPLEEYERVTLPPLECRAAYLRQVSRTSYLSAVDSVFDAATDLSRIDVDRQRAIADLAKAEAEKAKAELAKSKADETATKNAEIVESLESGAIEAARKALLGCGESCGKKAEDEKPSKKEDDKKD
jgi:hypothetical protein